MSTFWNVRGSDPMDAVYPMQHTRSVRASLVEYTGPIEGRYPSRFGRNLKTNQGVFKFRVTPLELRMRAQE